MGGEFLALVPNPSEGSSETGGQFPWQSQLPPQSSRDLFLVRELWGFGARLTLPPFALIASNYLTPGVLLAHLLGKEEISPWKHLFDSLPRLLQALLASVLNGTENRSLNS